jgi:uncharacterized protein YjiS (DUF1127 family)
MHLRYHLGFIKSTIALRRAKAIRSHSSAQPLSSSVCGNGIALPCETTWRRKMITLSQSTAQPAIPNWLGGFVRRMGVWAYALANYWERRAAIKTLRELDDRALRDIGISRCHIEAAVGGAFNPGMGKFG